VVVSVAGKGLPLSGSGVDQEGDRKKTTDEASKGSNRHQNRLDALARDEFGGYLLTARMVSGVKVARAWSWVPHGTCETDSIPCLAGFGWLGTREKLKWLKPRESEYRSVESVAGRPE